MRRAIRNAALAATLAAGLVAVPLPLALAQAPQQTKKTDRYGDLLPQGAVVRLGTTRWRHAGGVLAVAFSPDGKMVASGGRDGAVRLWDRASGKELRKLEGHVPWVASVAFTPDGKLLASGTSHNERLIRLWETASGKLVRSLRGHPNGTPGLAFSPDGKQLASVGADGKLWVRETATGKELLRFDAHGERAQCVAWAPDGRALASGGIHDRSLRLWDAFTGQEIRRFHGHQESIWSLAFSPDGRTLASGSGDGIGLLCDLTSWPKETGSGRPAKPEALWDDLGGADVARAGRAFWGLVAAPRAALPLLRDRLLPGRPAERTVAGLIADLDAKHFAVREKATRALEKLGAATAPALRRALAGKPSPEARRRLEALLAALDDSSRPLPAAAVRERRAVRVLEQIGSAEARAVLEKLVSVVEKPGLAAEASAALERAARRK